MCAATGWELTVHSSETVFLPEPPHLKCLICVNRLFKISCL